MSVCGSPGCSRREGPKGDNIQVLFYKGHTGRTKCSTMQPFICQWCAEKERPGLHRPGGGTASGWLLGVEKWTIKQNKDEPRYQSRRM